VTGIKPDAKAAEFVESAEHHSEAIRIIANRPGAGSLREYEDKLAEASDTHHLPAGDPVLVLGVSPGDAPQFSEILTVDGVYVGPYHVLPCRSAAIPYAIAALLIDIQIHVRPLPRPAAPRLASRPSNLVGFQGCLRKSFSRQTGSFAGRRHLCCQLGCHEHKCPATGPGGWLADPPLLS
jgi:hypothetical protein